MSRSRILQAANTMFCSCGLRSISIDDICHSIGIGKKTFYTFYMSKDDLVKEFVEHSFSRIHRTLLHNSMPQEAIQKLKMFDDHIANFLKIFYPALVSDLRRFHEGTYQIFIDNRGELIMCLASIIESGKQQGVFRENLNSLIIAELRFIELETIFSQRSETNLDDVSRRQEALFDHYLAGLVFKEQPKKV